MTNEQKIKELEAEIQKAKDRIANEQAYTNSYIKARQAEIEELKKSLTLKIALLIELNNVVLST